MGSFLSSQSQLPPAPACSSAAAPAATATATADPHWILLAPYGGGSDEACNITGDTKTIAAAATSNGHRISVSVRREPFSALSRICLFFPPSAANGAASSTVIAAHNDSVLMRITSRENGYLAPCAYDYFVYNNVGAAAADPARPPSLYLLPRGDQWWRLDINATGFLCHAEAEFVVAQLKTLWVKGDATPNKAAELHMFRHGKWCVMQRRIIHCHGKDGDLFLASWEPRAVVPLGDRLLCWVDFFYGVIFSDLLDDMGPELRYVPYPAEALEHRRFLCTNARGAVKLVAVSPRRCSQCGCSEHATATDTWTWKLKTDDMAWVLETETNIIDSAELWALTCNPPGYARMHLVYPFGSMNGGGHVASDESTSPTPMEEKDDEHPSLCVTTPLSINDELQGGHGATSAYTCEQQQSDNRPATVGRSSKRRRRANSMVTGPEWIS